MPLINCPDCKKTISDSAQNCPDCGFPIKKFIEDNEKNKIKKGCWTFIFVVGGIFFLSSMVEKCSDNKSNTNTSVIEPNRYSEEDFAITKEDSIRNVARIDSISKQNEIEERQFLKTKAGRIYKKHPDWSKEDCINLADKRIWIGMEYEMVVYMRGKPNTVNTSNYGNGLEYQACWDDYDPGCFYFGEDHIIKSYN